MTDGTATDMITLVVDVGGNNVKYRFSTDEDSAKFKSGKDLTPQSMLDQLLDAVSDRPFDRITIGFPSPVRNDRILLEPANLGSGWVDFDFSGAFDKPVRVINDAAMQALGSYEGGTMLFIGLGTGLGGALVLNGIVAPLEVAHLPYKDEMTFEDFVGERGRKAFGREKWEKAVHDVVERLRLALVADSVVIGGGNAKRLKALPPRASLGHNRNAFEGGFRIWGISA